MMFRNIAICTFALSVMTAMQPSFAAETLQQRGKQLAQRLCGGCHAIGRRGASPLPAAPRFRTLDDRIDLSALPRRLRDGRLTGHQDMPTFRFTRGDADALVAYMRFIQGQ
jgi:mono/diheme cytochrome c family protein